MNQSKKHFFCAIMLVTGFLPSIALAQPASGNPFSVSSGYINQLGSTVGIQGTDLTVETVIGRILNVVFGFLGVILLALFLYGGFLWMTAGGDKENVEKATATIRNAVIGLVIVMLSFSLTSFILGQLATVGRGT